MSFAQFACRAALALIVLVLAVGTVPSIAHAQPTAPRMRAVAQPTEVEVGDVFVVQLTAMVRQGDPAPSNPHLRVPPSIILRGEPTTAIRTEANLSSSSPVILTGIEVSWRLTARHAGTFRIGPPSVDIQGNRFEANSVEVNVVPAGAHPRAPAQPTPDPFDPFGMFGFPKLPSLGGDPFDEPTRRQLPPDPALDLNAAPDSHVFLRAVVDKSRVVLGEQVTLSVYRYSRSHRVDTAVTHEPSTPEFLQRPLLPAAHRPEERMATVAGNPWYVEQLSKTALFALRTGLLEIGPTQATIRGIGLGSRGASEITRQSPPLQIHVIDTPAKGRPPGFRPGDVGAFALSATVEPRTVEAEGAVGVTVVLTGTGNLPLSVPLPHRKGVEWLDPDVRDTIDVQRDKIAGTRRFVYVVRMHQVGAIELGEVELPFYDPERRAYETTRAPLGRVTVTPSALPVPNAPALPDPFAAVGPSRGSLGEYHASPPPVTDRTAYWILLGAGPFIVVTAGSATRWAKRWKNRWSSWRTSLSRQADRCLREALDAARRGDAKGGGSALERAVCLAIEASTKLKPRGMLREELAEQMRRFGVDAATGRGVLDLLAACESVRFEPNADCSKLGELVRDGRSVLRALRGCPHRRSE